MSTEEIAMKCDQIIASEIELESTDDAINKLLSNSRKEWKGEGKEYYAQEKRFCAGPN